MWGRNRNARYEAIIEINNEMIYMRKELERSWDKAGASGAALTSTEVEVLRLASDIYREREQSKGSKSDGRATVNRVKAAAVR